MCGFKLPDGIDADTVAGKFRLAGCRIERGQIAGVDKAKNLVDVYAPMLGQRTWRVEIRGRLLRLQKRPWTGRACRRQRWGRSDCDGLIATQQHLDGNAKVGKIKPRNGYRRPNTRVNFMVVVIVLLLF